MRLNFLRQGISGAAIEVQRGLGLGLSVERQSLLPIRFKKLVVKDAYRIDLLVENKIIIELKSVEKLQQIHSAQLLTYLKLSNKHLGLLINFNVPLLKDGVRRLANQPPEQ